jgi:hypothetical protein
MQFLWGSQNGCQAHVQGQVGGHEIRLRRMRTRGNGKRTSVQAVPDRLDRRIPYGRQAVCRLFFTENLQLNREIFD